MLILIDYNENKKNILSMQPVSVRRLAHTYHDDGMLRHPPFDCKMFGFHLICVLQGCYTASSN